MAEEVKKNPGQSPRTQSAPAAARPESRAEEGGKPDQAAELESLRRRLAETEAQLAAKSAGAPAAADPDADPLAHGKSAGSVTALELVKHLKDTFGPDEIIAECRDYAKFVKDTQGRALSAVELLDHIEQVMVPAAKCGVGTLRRLGKWLHDVTWEPQVGRPADAREELDTLNRQVGNLQRQLTDSNNRARIAQSVQRELEAKLAEARTEVQYLRMARGEPANRPALVAQD